MEWAMTPRTEPSARVTAWIAATKATSDDSVAGDRPWPGASKVMAE